MITLIYSRPPRDGRGPGGPPRRGVRLHVVGIPDRTSWQVGFFPTSIFLAIGLSLLYSRGLVIPFLICVGAQWRSSFSGSLWSGASESRTWFVESGPHWTDRRATGESLSGWDHTSLLGASLTWSTMSLSIIFSLNLANGSSLLWSCVLSVQS